MRIPVKDPDSYHKTQHELQGNRNANDLHNGYQITIGRTGFSNGAHHYGVFIIVFNPITGSRSSTNIKYFEEESN